jgi:hypothetical protein
MDRKKQIELALKDLNEVPLNKDRPYFDYGFIRGVEWADQNPMKFTQDDLFKCEKELRGWDDEN